MLKRMILFLAALMLFALPVQAENPAASSVYLLVDRSAEGVDTPLGSAVLFQDQSTLLTSVWATLAANELYALGEGGSFAIDRVGLPSKESTLALLTLAQASPARPLTLSDLEGEATVLGYQGTQPVASPMLYPSFFEMNGALRLLFTTSAPVLPGSAIVDANGGLVALTTSSYSEGENRYVALPVDALTAMLSPTPAAPEGVSWLSGFTATPGAGRITVDWANALPHCDQEDCCIALFFSDTQNTYFSYVIAEDETSTTLCLTPGRTFKVWIQHAHGEPVVNIARPAEAAVSVTLPEAVPFQRYGYQDQEFYLGAVPAAEAASVVKAQPLEDITAQVLSSPDTALFVQAVSTYTVAENAQVDLLLVLTTPEGYAFDYLGAFIFDVTLQQGDVWNVDVTPLFDDYFSFNNTGEAASGDYALRYYLDGELGNEITWTLE